MKHYELNYLIASDASEEEIKTLNQNIISSIREKGGILDENAVFYKRKPIHLKRAKKSQGCLVSADFQINPENLIDIEKKIKSQNQIIRHLIVTKKPSQKIIAPRRRKTKTILEGAFPVSTKAPEKKAELKEIEKKLEEILE